MKGLWTGQYKAQSGACTSLTQDNAALNVTDAQADNNGNVTFKGTLKLSNFPVEATKGVIPNFRQEQPVTGSVVGPGQLKTITIYYNGGEIMQDQAGYNTMHNPTGITFEASISAVSPCYIAVGWPDYLYKTK